MSPSILGHARARAIRIRKSEKVLVCLLLAICCWLLPAAIRSTRASTSAISSADGCTSCHQTRSANISTLFGRSIHGQAGKSCSSCHGGDPNAIDKQTAHGAGFIGQPTASEQLRMCGMCHRAQLVAFRGSGHAPGTQAGQRPDCVQCHGAHGVGVRAPDFSLPYYCSGCHGLEYLPALPKQWQDMLSASDDIRNGIRGLEESGRHPSAEVTSSARGNRKQIAEVVHSTNLQGGIEKSQEILKLAEAVKKGIASSK